MDNLGIDSPECEGARIPCFSFIWRHRLPVPRSVSDFVLFAVHVKRLRLCFYTAMDNPTWSGLVVSALTCVGMSAAIRGWEYLPFPIIVPEEKERNGAFRSVCLNVHVTPLAEAHATEPGYPNRRRRSWCQPFFNRGTQRRLCCFHSSLLRERVAAGQSYTPRRNFGHWQCGGYCTPADTLLSLGQGVVLGARAPLMTNATTLAQLPGEARLAPWEMSMLPRRLRLPPARLSGCSQQKSVPRAGTA